jgi:hypothetical protein
MVTIRTDGTGTMTDAKHAVDESEMGPWVDGVYGVYMGEHIQAIAAAHGYGNGRITGPDDGEEYTWDTDEAEEYMQALAPEGYYFGYSDGFGDWGLWHIHEDDSEACAVCEG